MCRQTARYSAGTAEAYGHKVWWQLPGEALGMDALTTKGNAGKRQVPTLEQQRLTAGLGGSCRDGFGAF